MDTLYSQCCRKKAQYPQGHTPPGSLHSCANAQYTTSDTADRKHISITAVHFYKSQMVKETRQKRRKKDRSISASSL